MTRFRLLVPVVLVLDSVVLVGFDSVVQDGGGYRFGFVSNLRIELCGTS
jgi:hypothetical protein